MKSIIQKTFGSQRNKPIHGKVIIYFLPYDPDLYVLHLYAHFLSEPSSSFGVDDSIYFFTEEQNEGHLEIEPRSQTMDNLARAVRTKTSGLSDNKQAKPETTKSFDRFPFSSRPPQFTPNNTSVTNKTNANKHQQRSTPLYRVDSYASKIELKRKPSMSNPNVLFCAPEDMTKSIVY